MYVGRINKENPDVSRFTVDLSQWLDDGETATDILTHTITLGTTGWSDTPYPPPGSPPPYDPTPLLYTEVALMDGGTALEVYVSFGTPGNVYTCQFEIIGTTLREVTFEVGVQITGTPPAAPPVVLQPIPLDALSIHGGTMQGPLYLYRDPQYPTEAATKQYADWVTSQLHVENKVSKSGDTMTGFLQLYANPVQPLQAATKAYVDMQSGSGLTDAPTDGFVYGRQSLAWTRSVAEAPLNAFGYLRSNGAWVKGVPEIGTTIDVRVTDGGGLNVPVLSGMQTPFSAMLDYFDLVARRTSTGAAGDGGVVQLFGPTHPSLANAVSIVAGTRATAKFWSFVPDGTSNMPGPVLAAGTLRSDTGRVVSHTTDNSVPVVMGWDQGHNVASGFYVGSSGALGFGSFDGGGTSLATWATLTSTGITVPSLTTAGSITATGNIVSQNGVYARGALFFGPGDTGYLTSDGTNAALQFRSDNWNLYWNGSTGTLSFNRPGVTMWSVDASGNGTFLGTMSCSTGFNVPSLGGGYATFSAFSYDSVTLTYAANGSRAGNILWSNSFSGGYTQVNRTAIAPGGAAIYFWYTDTAAFGVSGSTVSDRRTKSNSVPAGDALTKLLAMPVYECDRALPEFTPRHLEYSVMSDDVFAQVPSMVIRSDDPAMFDMIDPLVSDALMIRAIQQLAERVTRLENPTPA